MATISNERYRINSFILLNIVFLFFYILRPIHNLSYIMLEAFRCCLVFFYQWREHNPKKKKCRERSQMDETSEFDIKLLFVMVSKWMERICFSFFHSIWIKQNFIDLIYINDKLKADGKLIITCCKCDFILYNI